MKNDGGPAYPSVSKTGIGGDHNEITFYDGQVGMSLLDYFAGQALAGIEASETEGHCYATREAAANAAYDQAEAMITERERRAKATAQGSVATTIGGDPGKELAAKCRDESDREGE